jgi:prepilin-type processing-associated H-X9-DG protein/prepilin-type N-terminal cleavage/methylation domain-containing protein
MCSPDEIAACESHRPTFGRCGQTCGIGFTLIELLVVIAIISLLVSILLPTLTRAKELAQAAVCLSNLNHAGLSLVYYAEDNEGWTVPALDGVHWPRVISPEPILWDKPTVYACPSLPMPQNVHSVMYTYGIRTVAMDPRVRFNILKDVVCSSRAAVMFGPASECWILADSGLYVDGQPVHQYYMVHEYPPTGVPMKIDRRHSDKANVWFADGHVGSLAYSGFEALPLTTNSGYAQQTRYLIDYPW